MSARRMTWKRQERPTGLTRVGAPERGLDLRIGGIAVARVLPHDSRRHGKATVWWWVAMSDGVRGIAYRNEHDAALDFEQAKRECRAYVVESMAAHAAKVST